MQEHNFFNSLKKSPALKEFPLNQQLFIKVIQKDRKLYIESMAIIRIVVGVRQQQIRQQQIHQRKRLNLGKIKNMERQQSMNLNSNQPMRRGQNMEEQRSLSRNHQRRELCAYRLGSHNNNIIREVPQEIRPFLIQLQESDPNPNNTTVYHPQPSQYRVINPNNLQVNLQTSSQLSTHHQQRKKQISYQKIIIYGLVWMKQVNGLFDYQQKDKNQKSTIVIEDDVKGCINFIQNVEESMLPKQNDVYLLIFKKKDRRIEHERKTLKEIQITALKRQQNNTTFTPIQQERQFLCGLKLIMNTRSNQFTIKVFSYNQLSNQVRMIKKPKLIQGMANLNLTLTDLNTNTSHDPKSQPYFIVRTLSKSQPIGKKVYTGDLIKLGKIQFKVVSIDGVSVEDKNCEQDRKALEVTQIDEETEKEIECKYCLGGKSQEQDNFFLHLCNCKGHIAYVHYNCLTTWTKTKASVETSENVKMYFLEKMKCQVCTKEFPKYFKYDGKIFHLLPIELPQKHMLLVDVSQRQDSIIALISGDTENPIIVGRGRAASLRISDITVSRQHASIQRIGDDYYVKDCKSKFGTLVRSSEKQVQQGIENKKGFQIGNVIFTVQVVTKQVEVQQEKQQMREFVQQFSNLNNQNQQIQQKVQQNQSENEQSHKNMNKFSGKYQGRNLKFEKEQYNNDDRQNYQRNQGNNEEELEENTRATKRSGKKQLFNEKNQQTEERSNQTSAFRRKPISRSRSRNQNQTSQINYRPAIQVQERRKRSETKRRDTSK